MQAPWNCTGVNVLIYFAPLMIRQRDELGVVKHMQTSTGCTTPLVTASPGMDAHVKNTMQRSAKKEHAHFAANTINHLMYYSLTSGHRTNLRMFFTTHCEKTPAVGSSRLHHPSLCFTLPSAGRSGTDGVSLTCAIYHVLLALMHGCLSPLGAWAPWEWGRALISQPDSKVIYSHCFTVWHSHVNTHRQVKERNLYVTLTWPWSHQPPVWHYQSPAWSGRSPASSFSP